MTAYRKLLPAELPRYRAHLLRLDAADRHARFAGTVSDGVIDAHCDRLDWRRTTLIGAIAQGNLCGAAELCTDRVLWPDNAELALSVERSFQEHGVGRALVRRLLTVARNRGIRRVHMTCLASNLRMRALARRFGAVLEMDGGDVLAVFDLPPPTHLSLTAEALDDGTGAVGCVLDQFARPVDRLAA